MKQRTVTSLALAALVTASFGCMKTETTEGRSPQTATTAEIAGTTNPDDLNPIAAHAYIDDVTMGHMLNADGTMMAGHMSGETGDMPMEHVSDTFAPGQPVHLSMRVSDAPADAAVKVVWYGPNDTLIAEDQKNIPAGATILAFSATDTSKWPIGDCRAEVWIGDEKVSTKQFKMTNETIIEK
jgi:hypothetical protein